MLVTGATGFLGATVSGRLEREGHAVRRMMRTADATSAVESVIVRDLTDVEAIADAMKEIDSVVHMAARVHVMKQGPESAAQLWRTNVEGTQNLLDAAVAAGVRKFIFVSSVKAVGEENDRPWNEDTEPHPREPYGMSKLEGERIALEVGRHSNMHVIVLRLPIAYGPRMKGNMLRLFGAIRRGVPLPFRSVHNRRSMVCSANVAEAITSVLASPAARGETFFVSDGEDLSTPELLRKAGAALGRTPRLFSVPENLLRTAGKAGDAVSRLTEFPISSEMMQKLLGSLTVDIGKLRRLTSYRPGVSVTEGLALTARWYLEGGR